MHCTGHTSTHARSLVSMHASVMTAIPDMGASVSSPSVPHIGREAADMGAVRYRTARTARVANLGWSTTRACYRGQGASTDVCATKPTRRRSRGPWHALPRSAPVGDAVGLVEVESRVPCVLEAERCARSGGSAPILAEVRGLTAAGATIVDVAEHVLTVVPPPGAEHVCTGRAAGGCAGCCGHQH